VCVGHANWPSADGDAFASRGAGHSFEKRPDWALSGPRNFLSASPIKFPDSQLTPGVIY
jgi:hypothetical protein